MVAFTKLDVSRKARELLVTGWAQAHAAKTERGDSTYLFGVDAKCFCLSGALSRAAFELGGFALRQVGMPRPEYHRSEARRVAGAVYADLQQELGGAEPYEWNDEPCRTQAEVLGLLDKVIARLEKEAA